MIGYSLRRPDIIAADGRRGIFLLSYRLQNTRRDIARLIGSATDRPFSLAAYYWR